MSESEEIFTNDYRVFNLVRLAIASEYNKKGLKREDIFDKVCSSMRKAPIFKQVFNFANDYLEEHFAYKLEPMPYVTAALTAAAKTNQSRKAAVNQMNKSSKSGPPSHYMLISTLKIEERTRIRPSCRDPVRLAIIQAILLIIKLSGNSIEHNQLFTALNEIQLCRNDTRELGQDDLEPFLEQMRRERYILKERKSLMEAESVYSWGPRAYVEFPSNNMAEFLFKVATTDNKEEVEARFQEKALRVLKQTDPEKPQENEQK